MLEFVVHAIYALVDEEMQKIVFLSNNAPGYVPYERLVENGPILYTDLRGWCTHALISNPVLQYFISLLWNKGTLKFCFSFHRSLKFCFGAVGCQTPERRCRTCVVYHLQLGGEDDEHGVSLTCCWLYLPNIKRNVLNICSLYKIILYKIIKSHHENVLEWWRWSFIHGSIKRGQAFLMGTVSAFTMCWDAMLLVPGPD